MAGHGGRSRACGRPALGGATGKRVFKEDMLRIGRGTSPETPEKAVWTVHLLWLVRGAVGGQNGFQNALKLPGGRLRHDFF